MISKPADLYFGQTHQPVGFTSAVVAQFDGSAEPVVRELIQNSLDATGMAGRRPGEIKFIICRIPREHLPGLETYERVMQSAQADRRRWNEGKPSHDERMVIKRIEGALQASEIDLLLCIDNGHGLSGRRMDALLTPGNTDKGEAGAGSFGLGHHAAFGASYLRYVLYGAKYRDDTGDIRTISSGHAILATHFNQDKGVRAADGYWFKSDQGQLAFDGTHRAYPGEPPELLMPYLSALPDTGTVVCIAGFNDFHQEDDDPAAAQLICRVAASNFSDAIHTGDLTVTVEDERHSTVQQVTWTSLSGVLEQYSQNRRAEKQGQINGETAFNAWRTIHMGEPMSWSEGGVIYWRRRQEPDRVPKQVHVFRKGMWITSRAPGLLASDFSNTWPFDAVLALYDGPLEELVRSAEGPEHRGLDRKRLDPTQKKEFRELVAEVADRLRAAVGERDDNEEYTPPGFAMLSGHTIREAEPVRRSRLPAGGGSAKERVVAGEGESGAKGRRPRRQGTPRGGSIPRYRTTLRADVQTSVIEARVEYDEEVGPQSETGVRVRTASGADGTCEQPLPDTFLRLTSVSDDAGARVNADMPGGALELALPAVSGSRIVTVTLASPLLNPQLLELDLVKRRPAKDDPEPGENT